MRDDEHESPAATEQRLRRTQLLENLLAEARKLSDALRRKRRWRFLSRWQDTSITGFYGAHGETVRCWKIGSMNVWIDQNRKLFRLHTSDDRFFIDLDPVHYVDNKNVATLTDAMRTMRENLQKGA